MYEITQGDILIHGGRADMFIPDGGAHVRQVFVQIPRFVTPPVITATVAYRDGRGEPGGESNIGSTFVVWDINYHYSDDEPADVAHLKISAANTETADPQPDIRFTCDYVVMGRVAPSDPYPFTDDED